MITVVFYIVPTNIFGTEDSRLTSGISVKSFIQLEDCLIYLSYLAYLNLIYDIDPYWKRYDLKRCMVASI